MSVCEVIPLTKRSGVEAEGDAAADSFILVEVMSHCGEGMG